MLDIYGVFFAFLIRAIYLEVSLQNYIHKYYNYVFISCFALSLSLPLLSYLYVHFLPNCSETYCEGAMQTFLEFMSKRIPSIRIGGIASFSITIMLAISLEVILISNFAILSIITSRYRSIAFPLISRKQTWMFVLCAVYTLIYIVYVVFGHSERLFQYSNFRGVFVLSMLSCLSIFLIDTFPLSYLVMLGKVSSDKNSGGGK